MAQARLRPTLAGLAAVALTALPAQSGQNLSLRERLALQRSLESVWWNLRVWPEVNPTDRPALEQRLTIERLEAKVLDGLRKSRALELRWHRPITTAMLQAEIDRMARDSRRPEVLRDLWAALGYDPYLIAECLARPLLADRLIRSAFSADREPSSNERAPDQRVEPTFEEWWESAAAEFVPQVAARAANYTLPELAAASCTDDSWRTMRSIPLARSGHVAVWTGAEMLVWGGILSAEITGKTGGRYDPATDTWHPISGIGDPTGRTGPTGVWSGAELIVWGGWGGGFTDNVFNSGGRYDPLLDLWTPTSTGTAVPTPRIGHSAVWTGTAMLIWGGDSRGLGGQRSDGALYDPVLDQWTAINGAGAPSARVGHSAVWADTEMIVWGGTGGSTPLDTGGRYDPAQEQWTDLPTDGAPEARNLQTAIWSGSELIVWGGCTISSGCFSPTNSGGRFDPAQNQWQATSLTDAPVGRRFHSAIWTGDEMIVWGGCVDHDCSDHRSSGGRYDPAGDAWVATQTTGPPFGRSMHTAVWTGAEMIVWGGCSGGECQNSTASGGRFDPVQNLWNPTSAEDAPSRRINHTAVWTGAEMIVWGGFDPLGGTASGKRYDPATDHWTGTSSSGAPFARDAHSAVWTGTEMIVWGGRVNGIGAHNSGGRYDPVLDTWADTDMTGAPQGRDFHPAVWTGTEMIVWGGCSDGGCGAGLDNGGRYDPVQDLWQPTPASGAPSARAFHSAIWTGSAMLVWGGCDATCSNPLASGASYVPGQTSWTTLPAADAPAARQSHTAVWTGAEMIVWGGRAGATVLGDGGAFAPVGAWRTINPLEAPGPRYNHDAVWSGAEMMVWGGCADLFCSALEFSGGRYAPLADTWSATSTGPFTPFSRSSHTMVAAGDEVLVWGGWRGMSSALTNTGASYCASGGAEVVAGAGVGGGSLLRRVAVR